MITMPLFGDQSKNSMMAKKHGISVHLGKGSVTKENVVAAIREIIDNPELVGYYYRIS